MRPDCMWCQGGRPHIHASDIGKCRKATIAERLGMKAIGHDDATLRRFAEGHLHERDVIERMLPAEGWEVTYPQGEWTLPAAGTTVLCHLDGSVFAASEPIGVLNQVRVLEVKAPGTNEYKKWIATRWDTPGLWQDYKWPTACYMHATGRELMMAVKNRDTGELDISFLEQPFYTLDQIAERVAYIEDHVTRGVLPDDCPHDWFCDFKYLCSRSSEDGAERSSDELSPDEVSAVSEYHRLGREIKALEDLRADTRLSVEALAGRSGGGYRVQMVTQQIKERVVSASTRQMLRVTKTDQGDDSADTP